MKGPSVEGGATGCALGLDSGSKRTARKWRQGAQAPAALPRGGCRVPHAFPFLASPFYPRSHPRPHGRSAPWRDSALRALGEDAAVATSSVQASAFLGLPPSSPASSSALKPVASRPPCRTSENGGCEAGREWPGFPAGAERRGLQTRRGQVHHARVSPGPSPVSPCCVCFSFSVSRSRLPCGRVLLRNVRLWLQPKAAARLGLSSWVWTPVYAPGRLWRTRRPGRPHSPAREIPARCFWVLGRALLLGVTRLFPFLSVEVSHKRPCLRLSPSFPGCSCHLHLRNLQNLIY